MASDGRWRVVGGERAESGRVARALTIAGSDSGGGAGAQADLKTFAAFRVYGASALTAVTAQDTLSVRALVALPPDLVAAQIAAVRDDIGVDAAKIGMLGSAGVVRAVAAAVRAGGLGPVVLDPVLRASRGGTLLEPGALAVLRADLLPLVDVVTPNLPETAALLGCDVRALDAPMARRDAARALTALGPRCAVIKGGHLPEVVPGATDAAVDVWWCAGAFGELTGPRIATRHTHGTGCTFSAALAAGLARGWDPAAALAAAKAFVGWALAHAPGLGHGQGPLQHLLPDPEWERMRAGAEPAPPAVPWGPGGRPGGGARDAGEAGS